MAAIIAQITRAKRERDKKKTYQTEKCMWVMPHLYLLAIPPAHYFAWLWRLSSCPPKRKEKRCCKILSQVRPPTIWLPLWPCSAQQILGKVKKQHQISIFPWANKVGQTVFDQPYCNIGRNARQVKLLVRREWVKAREEERREIEALHRWTSGAITN